MVLKIQDADTKCGTLNILKTTGKNWCGRCGNNQQLEVITSAQKHLDNYYTNVLFAPLLLKIEQIVHYKPICSVQRNNMSK